MNGDNINRVVNKYMPWEEESLDEWKESAFKNLKIIPKIDFFKWIHSVFIYLLLNSLIVFPILPYNLRNPLGSPLWANDLKKWIY